MLRLDPYGQADRVDELPGAIPRVLSRKGRSPYTGMKGPASFGVTSPLGPSGPVRKPC